MYFQEEQQTELENAAYTEVFFCPLNYAVTLGEDFHCSTLREQLKAKTEARLELGSPECEVCHCSRDTLSICNSSGLSFSSY